MPPPRQQWIALLAALGVIAAVLAITGWRPPHTPRGDAPLRALYGDAGLALLEAPPRWEAWLLHAGPVGEAAAFQGVARRGGALTVNTAGFEGLLALLRDPRTFGPAAEPCGQAPLVGMRLSDADANLDLLLCFDCDLLQVCFPDRRPARRFHRAALLPHVKRLWPRDPEVQALR